MSVKLYDDALVEKLRNWTQNTQITIVGPDETRRLFEVVADKTQDKPIQLPLLVLTRPGGYTISDGSLWKKPMSYDGFTLDANYDQSSQLNAISIEISYQLDVYTRYLEQADEYARNLVFNIINFPKLTVNIPYNNENYKHVSNIRLQGEIEDNSDIPERLIPGQFTRYTMRFDIDDAYLWDVRYRDNYSICTHVYTEEEYDKIKDDLNEC